MHIMGMHFLDLSYISPKLGLFEIIVIASFVDLCELCTNARIVAYYANVYKTLWKSQQMDDIFF